MNGVVRNKEVKVSILPNDKRFVYGGRWESGHHLSSPIMEADWTCSDIWFSLHVGPSGGRIPIIWYGERVRINVTVFESSIISSAKVLVGPWLDDPLFEPMVGYIDFPHSSSSRNYTLRLQKITAATPFGPGIGHDVFRPSIFRFFGLGDPEYHPSSSQHEENENDNNNNDDNIHLINPLFQWNRRIVSIGGSDTAGYCVDGTKNITGIKLILSGWEYVNCEFSYPSLLGTVLESHVNIFGISGIGIVQNAKAKQPWQLGKLTMPNYYNRTLQTDKDHLWNFFSSSNISEPDLITISLGGNDYNHQEGDIPSNKTFFKAYSDFLQFLFHVHESSKIAVLCGMGSPNEVKFDPDNNRCRPCPFVEKAVLEFQKSHHEFMDRITYIFIPCDGSVVTGEGDIGCNGHKNRKGQREVAEFLEPKIRKFMGW